MCKFAGPVIEPFPEEEGAFAAAQRLVEKYTEIVDGHQAAIRQFLENCLPVVLEFQCEPDEFERLKADPFWEEASRQKPKAQQFLSVHDQVANLFHVSYPETATAE